MQKVPPKLWYITTKLHVVISHKKMALTFSVVGVKSLEWEGTDHPGASLIRIRRQISKQRRHATQHRITLFMCHDAVTSARAMIKSPQARPISESEQQKADRDRNWRHNTAGNDVPLPLLVHCTGEENSPWIVGKHAFYVRCIRNDTDHWILILTCPWFILIIKVIKIYLQLM